MLISEKVQIRGGNTRGLPTQSTTASGHKFGDRGYDNDLTHSQKDAVG